MHQAKSNEKILTNLWDMQIASNCKKHGFFAVFAAIMTFFLFQSSTSMLTSPGTSNQLSILQILHHYISIYMANLLQVAANKVSFFKKHPP